MEQLVLLETPTTKDLVLYINLHCLQEAGIALTFLTLAANLAGQ